MIVRNPTKENISIKIQGRLYTVKARDELPGVPENHAKHWQRIHSFIQVSGEGKPVIPPVEAKVEVKKEDSEKVKSKPESKKAKPKK